MDIFIARILLGLPRPYAASPDAPTRTEDRPAPHEIDRLFAELRQQGR